MLKEKVLLHTLRHDLSVPVPLEHVERVGHEALYEAAEHDTGAVGRKEIISFAKSFAHDM